MHEKFFALKFRPALAAVRLLAAAAFLALAAAPSHAQANRKVTLPPALVNFITNLLNFGDAAAMSVKYPALQDLVGQSCWTSFAPIDQIVKDQLNGGKLTLNLQIATHIEILRLLALAANDACANPNCGQMWLDGTNASAAIAGTPIPISFTSFCSKIPVIGRITAQSVAAAQKAAAEKLSPAVAAPALDRPTPAPSPVPEPTPTPKQ